MTEEKSYDNPTTTGRILENKGMRAAYQKKGKRVQ